MKKIFRNARTLFDTGLIKIAMSMDKKKGVALIDFFWGKNLKDEFNYRHNLDFEVMLRIKQKDMYKYTELIQVRRDRAHNYT